MSAAKMRAPTFCEDNSSSPRATSGLPVDLIQTFDPARSVPIKPIGGMSGALGQKPRPKLISKGSRSLGVGIGERRLAQGDGDDFVDQVGLQTRRPAGDERGRIVGGYRERATGRLHVGRLENLLAFGACQDFA